MTAVRYGHRMDTKSRRNWHLRFLPAGTMCPGEVTGRGIAAAPSYRQRTDHALPNQSNTVCTRLDQHRQPAVPLTEPCRAQLTGNNCHPFQTVASVRFRHGQASPARYGSSAGRHPQRSSSPHWTVRQRPSLPTERLAEATCSLSSHWRPRLDERASRAVDAYGWNGGDQSHAQCRLTRTRS